MKRKKITQGAAILIDEVRKRGGDLLKNMDHLKICTYVRYFFVFGLSFLLGAARGSVGTYPFSYAVLAAARGGIDCALSFVGTVLATTTMDTGGVVQVLILSSMLVARSAFCIAKGDLREKKYTLQRIYRERGYIRTIIAAAGAAAYGCVYIISSSGIYYGLFSALLNIGTSAVVCASLIFLGDKKAESSKKMAGLAVFAAGVSSACNILPLPFSLSAVLSYLSTVYFSYTGGALTGITVGAAAGLGVGVQYSAAFGSVGLICALLWEHSHIGAVVTSALSCCVLALFGGGLDALSDLIPEVTLGAAVAAPFVTLGPIPKRLPAFLRTGEKLAGFPQREEKSIGKVLRVGEALDGVSKMLHSISARLRLPTKQEATTICTSARAKYCSGCVHEKDCSGADKRTVDSMFSNMSYRLTTNGRVSARIVPEGVARRCFNMDAILDFVNKRTRKTASLSGGVKNSELFASDYSAVATLMRAINEDDPSVRDEEAEALLKNVLFEAGFSFSQAAVYSKRARRIYMRGIDLSAARAGEEDIRKLCESVLGTRLSSPEFSIETDSVSASMHSVPRIRIEAGKYALRSKRDNTSGDSACVFQNDEGYYYSLVSDGMGSGREAAVTSGISAAILEKLLSAGCPMRSALELLNNYVRAARGECFTTVDLMEADLYTGKARFIKSGAAPSFIIRGGQLYRIHSKTVPVGIMRALDAESVAFDLALGDTVVMMSDGVSGSYEDSPWLYELLSSPEAGITDPDVLARSVAKSAAQSTGREDDITVCVLRVEDAFS